MKYILALIFVFFCLPSGRLFAQVSAIEPVQKNVDILKQDGRLFSVRISKGQPLKIFVVGKEEANLDLSKMKLVVRRLQPTPEVGMSFERQGDHYLLKESLQGEQEIEIVPRVKDKTETFRFKLKSEKP